MTAAFIIAIIIAFIVVVIQACFFCGNLRKMCAFANIFQRKDTWELLHEDDDERGKVRGIEGQGNAVFRAIKASINGYLDANKGAVIDFSLLKDAVDRHCDALEEDINQQTPVPLYLGLMGTMLGVIIGLASLLLSGSLTELIGGTNAVGTTAAGGVSDLLGGVAAAMVASVFGILFTTIASQTMKCRKQREQQGKNDFLAWMQEQLLPRLTADSSQAMSLMVHNLHEFNDTFSSNTEQLRETLEGVNEVYQVQEQIFSDIKEMDVKKVSQANVAVLRELRSCLTTLPNCTAQVQHFCSSLDRIALFVEQVRQFTQHVNEESERVAILERLGNAFDEHKAFYERHKGEISKQTADAEDTLTKALGQLREAATSSIDDFKKTMQGQTANAEDTLTKALGQLREAATSSIEDFKKTMQGQTQMLEDTLKDQRQQLAQIGQEMATQFSEQLQQMPAVVTRLEQIARIPAELAQLARNIEQSNATLANQLTQAIKTSQRPFMAPAKEEPKPTVPAWAKWTMVGGIATVGLCCLANLAGDIAAGRFDALIRLFMNISH